jgi:hypothetical protein
VFGAHVRALTVLAATTTYKLSRSPHSPHTRARLCIQNATTMPASRYRSKRSSRSRPYHYRRSHETATWAQSQPVADCNEKTATMENLNSRNHHEPTCPCCHAVHVVQKHVDARSFVSRACMGNSAQDRDRESIGGGF